MLLLANFMGSYYMLNYDLYCITVYSWHKYVLCFMRI